MQNIVEILKGLEIELPEDKVSELNKRVAENYKTIAEFDKRVSKLESERDNYKSQFDTATETLKSFEGVDLEGINKQLAEYQKKAEDAERNYNAQLEQRDFNDALKEALEAYTFSSNSAKSAIESEIRASGLKLVDGKILGLNDLIENIKSKDASAFVEQNQTQSAKFTSVKGTKTGGQKMTKDEIMAVRDPVERQQLIAENLELFT